MVVMAGATGMISSASDASGIDSTGWNISIGCWRRTARRWNILLCRVGVELLVVARERGLRNVALNIVGLLGD
jgi:hypothetical protein